MIGFFLRSVLGSSTLQKAVRKRFNKADLAELVTAAREFPITSRVDVQAALEDLMER